MMEAKIYNVDCPIHGYQTYQVLAEGKRDAMNKVNQERGLLIDSNITHRSKATCAYIDKLNVPKQPEKEPK